MADTQVPATAEASAANAGRNPPRPNGGSRLRKPKGKGAPKHQSGLKAQGNLETPGSSTNPERGSGWKRVAKRQTRAQLLRRVADLERILARSHPTSRGRSDGTTSSGARVGQPTRPGPKRQAPLPPSQQPSTRKGAKRRSGTAPQDAPSVSQQMSSSQPARPSSSRGSQPSSGRSFAEVVTGSPVTSPAKNKRKAPKPPRGQSGPKESTRSAPEVRKVAGATQANGQSTAPSTSSDNPAQLPTGQAPGPSQPKGRDLPRYGGRSYEATVALGGKSTDKPKFVRELEVAGRPKVSKATKRAVAGRSKPGLDIFDKDCLYYLLDKFAFCERDSRLFRTMHVELGKYLNRFDLTGYTSQEIYHLKIETVAAAVRIPPAEQVFRASLKDEGALSELSKNNDFLATGRVGRVGALFKKTLTLPTSSR
nr:MAG: hypothetical protein [Tombusviridae sp.]